MKTLQFCNIIGKKNMFYNDSNIKIEKNSYGQKSLIFVSVRGINKIVLGSGPCNDFEHSWIYLIEFLCFKINPQNCKAFFWRQNLMNLELCVHKVVVRNASSSQNVTRNVSDIFIKFKQWMVIEYTNYKTFLFSRAVSQKMLKETWS